MPRGSASPDRGLLTGVARTNRFANDHKSGCDANADPQRSPATAASLTASGNGETCAHDAFGIGLTRFRPAEMSRTPSPT